MSEWDRWKTEAGLWEVRSPEDSPRRFRSDGKGLRTSWADPEQRMRYTHPPLHHHNGCTIHLIEEAGDEVGPDDDDPDNLRETVAVVGLVRSIGRLVDRSDSAVRFSLIELEGVDVGEGTE